MTVDEANMIMEVANRLKDGSLKDHGSGTPDQTVMAFWRMGIDALATTVLMNTGMYNKTEPTDLGDRFKLIEST